MGKKSKPATPPEPIDYKEESAQRSKEQKAQVASIAETKTELLTKKKRGRYSLLKTGGTGLVDEAKTAKKSLLG
jgi:hypothetical protein